MAQVHEHQNSTQSVDFSLDKETLGTLLVRHPWAIRFLAFEALVLSLAGLLPFLGESAFHYVAFGMLLSLAFVAAIGAAALSLRLGVRRARRELKYRNS
jgi:hypothetical protein